MVDKMKKYIDEDEVVYIIFSRNDDTVFNADVGRILSSAVVDKM